MAYSKEEILQQIIPFIAEKLGFDEKEIRPETTFTEDLGCDSLDAIELLMEAETGFGVALNDDVIGKVFTIRDAVEVIAEASEKKVLNQLDGLNKVIHQVQSEENNNHNKNYCPECGRKYSSEKDAFCPQCGHPREVKMDGLNKVIHQVQSEENNNHQEDFPNSDSEPINDSESKKEDVLHLTEDEITEASESQSHEDKYNLIDESQKEVKEEVSHHLHSEDKDLSGPIDVLRETVSSIQEIVENVQFNVSMLVQKQATAADMAVLQRENEAFRSDSNMKLMRRYGIDAMIKTYQAICDKLFRLKHFHSESENVDTEINTLGWVLKRIERQLKPLGIKLKSSQPGTSIDESVMVVYGSDGEDVDDSEVIIETNDVNLKDTVKESVCPAFVWTIPSLIGDAKEWYMEVEKVCIYK